ncbi:MAG: hypothetical protein H6Q24_1426 [Bacteroidetes bacterium]|nr:hypothetical protein [Bacteroidota bacterium]
MKFFVKEGLFHDPLEGCLTNRNKAEIPTEAREKNPLFRLRRL